MQTTPRWRLQTTSIHLAIKQPHNTRLFPPHIIMAVVGAHTPQVKQCQPRFYLTHGTPFDFIAIPPLRFDIWPGAYV